MPEEAQRQLNTRALEISAENKGVLDAMRNLFTAMTARLDSNERRLERFETEMREDRKHADAAREKVRADVIEHQDRHHAENKVQNEKTDANIGKLHGRINVGVAAALLMALSMVGTLGMLIIAMWNRALGF